MSSSAGGDNADTPLGTLRRLLLLKKPSDPHFHQDRNPLMIPSSSSFPSSPEPAKKMGFAAAAFRGLGCASSSSSQAFAPAAAAVRSSADWHHQSRRQPSRKRRPSSKNRKKKDRDRKGASSSSAVDDVWCAPGIAFGAADPPLDCVVPHPHPAGVRGRSDADRLHRERLHISRRVGHQEHLPSFMGSPTALEAPLFGQDILPSGHLRRLRGYRRSPGGLEEIMMFQTRILLGGMDAVDQYRELRLDVDHMSYEDLLELGDKIGYVSTGLREEEIFRNLRKMKHTIFAESSMRFSPEMEHKCSICQEEYEDEDEMGSLDCGHSYHLYCIKQWLIRKNACPVCKTAVRKS